MEKMKGKKGKKDDKTGLRDALRVNDWLRSFRLAMVVRAAGFAANAFIDDEIEIIGTYLGEDDSDERSILEVTSKIQEAGAELDSHFSAVMSQVGIDIERDDLPYDPHDLLRMKIVAAEEKLDRFLRTVSELFTQVYDSVYRNGAAGPAVGSWLGTAMARNDESDSNRFDSMMRGWKSFRPSERYRVEELGRYLYDLKYSRFLSEQMNPSYVDFAQIIRKNLGAVRTIVCDSRTRETGFSMELQGRFKELSAKAKSVVAVKEREQVTGALCVRMLEVIEDFDTILAAALKEAEAPSEAVA